MAVSKRLRFAVFQRDDHTCQYCGIRAGDQGTVLQIDHILPVSMGGRDEPTNLITACRDCNSGKSSSTIDQPKVAAPSIDAARWARAIEEATKERRSTAAEEKAACDAFLRHWPWSYPPDDWRPSVAKFIRMGVSADDVERIILLAADRTFGFEHCWRYFCKVCWSEVDAVRERAKVLLEREPEEVPEPAPVVEMPQAIPMPPVPEPEPADPFRETLEAIAALPPSHSGMAYRLDYCIECDDRPAVFDNMCEQCRDWHYNVGAGA